jgi:hypothetical protein
MVGESSVLSDAALLICSELSPSYPGESAFTEATAGIIGGIKMQPYRMAAFRSLLSRVSIRRRVSILNFILELKDFKRMFEYWDRHRKFLYNIASGHLNIRYGWRPFLTDVVGILKGLATYRSELKKLLAQEGKILVHKYKVSLPIPDYERVFRLPTVCLSRVPMASAVGTVAKTSCVSPTPFTCTIKYSYGIPELSKHQGEVRAFCDAFGVVWDPAIIWDAIPFSFIVDWFFRVGDFLTAANSIPAFQVTLTVHEACWSVKLQQSTGLYATWPEIGRQACREDPDPGFKNYGVAIQQGTSYQRFLDNSLSEQVLVQAGWDPFSVSHTLIGASLRFVRGPRK